MPRARRGDLGALEEQITRLEGSSEGLMSTRRFDKALPKMEKRPIGGFYKSA